MPVPEVIIKMTFAGTALSIACESGMSFAVEEIGEEFNGVVVAGITTFVAGRFAKSGRCRPVFDLLPTSHVISLMAKQ